jgi:hypothetical protein
MAETSEYPYKEGLTVRQAISMAGGLTEKAQLGTFQVLRRVNNHEETVAVGLDSLVFPDDIIVVAEWHRRNQASWELWHWPSRDRFGPPVRRCEPSLAHVRGSSCS